MAATLELIRRPGPDADPGGSSPYRVLGLVIGLVGLAVATLALVANLVAADRIKAGPIRAQEILAWSFGVNTTALAILKVGIAVVLIAIVLRLWIRVDSVKYALSRLKPQAHDEPSVTEGEVTTPYGPARVSRTAPEPLPIHRVARVAWAPMLAMGVMAVLAGLVVSVFWSTNVADSPGTARDLGAWTEGLQFLGEGLILAGISFLLGTILGGLREGGGEVQQSVGVQVKTLKMPLTAKLFIGLMAVGMMVVMAQFVLHIVTTAITSETTFAAWAAWLGAFRELGIGLLLAGIVLALVTIRTVLRFQFDRIAAILRTGA